jgi:uncharacterized membrane protein
MDTPKQNETITRTTIKPDRISTFFSRHWLFLLNTVVAIYVFLPILAPTLMQLGMPGPARVLYTMYSPMCHQMASRSFFLFGEQAAYPRELAGTNLQSLESYAADLPEFEGTSPENWGPFFLAARRFVGNEQMGYKMALCERDMAIYGFVLIGGLLYGLLRKRVNIRPLPLILFLIIGMGPIALDGFSQLFGYYALPLNGGEPLPFQIMISRIFALRESPPWLRFATGALFGFMLVWLIYPHIEEGMEVPEELAEVKTP